METLPSTQLAQPDRLSGLLNSPAIKAKFYSMLGSKSGGFLSSILSVTSGNKALKEVDPMTVIAAAAVAASMDLPINPALGWAYIVPYKGKAAFQIGWKGVYQLAMRSGKYKTINICRILEGQLKSRNSFTGEIEFVENVTSDKVIGYLLYFRLLNGFEKQFYMDKEAMEKHAKRYSQSYGSSGASVWKDDFDAMGMKTVCKLGLQKFGVLSIEMQKALEVDQAVVGEDGAAVEFPDAPLAEPEPQAPAEPTSSRLADVVNPKPVDPAKEAQVPL